MKGRFQTTAKNSLLSVMLLSSVVVACQGGSRRGRLESYRALAGRQSSDKSSEESDNNHHSEMASARLSAASLLLSREDLLPCDSLPPRRLSQTDGQISWVDGSWALQARPFIVKGSAQSGLCALEIRPIGQAILNPGEKDPFVRGSQIRVLLTTPAGDTLIPPANQGVVQCKEKDGTFVITYEGYLVGKSNISYVMSEAIPLELSPRVCLARMLDENRAVKNEWVFILPISRVAFDSNPHR